MTATTNNMKTSAAILIFFLSAAAWATHELIEEDHTSPQNTQVQSGTPNTDIVLRPLTD